MGMEKYGDAAPAEIFTGKQAAVVNDHLRRHGKALSDFTEDERKALDVDLDNAKSDEQE
jgi:hypothetical protein